MKNLLLAIFLASGCTAASPPPDVQPMVYIDAGPPADTTPEPPKALPQIWILTGGVTIDEQDLVASIKVIPDPADAADVSPYRKVSINVRGQFSATLPKKSYSFEYQDVAGGELDYEVLGMPAAADWALVACYTDKTCLRNAFVHDFGQGLGRWQPRFRFVEVYMNGQYHGLYHLTERIKRGAARVAIPKTGYVVRHEGTGTGEPGEDFRTGNTMIWSHVYPNATKITPEQRATVKADVVAMETALAGPDPLQAIDLASWVDQGLGQELTRNWDAYSRSFYLVNDGAKRMAYPLWDFDFALGNATMADRYQVAGWAWDNPGKVSWDAVPAFWLRLWADPTFQAAARARWQELRAGALSDAAVNARLSGWAEHIAEAQARDRALWHPTNAPLQGVHFQGETFEEDVEYLRGWLLARMVWLDGAL